MERNHPTLLKMVVGCVKPAKTVMSPHLKNIYILPLILVYLALFDIFVSVEGDIPFCLNHGGIQ
jgi:hypothetical protein